MSEIDALCGIILAAAAGCVFLVIGWSEGEVAGIAAVAVYAGALCWVFKRFQEKNTEIENLKKQHAIEITGVLNASRDKNKAQSRSS